MFLPPSALATASESEFPLVALLAGLIAVCCLLLVAIALLEQSNEQLTRRYIGARVRRLNPDNAEQTLANGVKSRVDEGVICDVRRDSSNGLMFFVCYDDDFVVWENERSVQVTAYNSR